MCCRCFQTGFCLMVSFSMYQSATGTYWFLTDWLIDCYMTIIEWQILLSWDYFHDWKKWLRRSVQEPCVLLKDTTNTAENRHPHQLNEASVVASNIDGGKEGGREEKKKRSWRWPSPRFPRRIAAKHELAEAEKKYQVQAGSYRTFIDGTTTSTCPVLTLGWFSSSSFLN